MPSKPRSLTARPLPDARGELPDRVWLVAWGRTAPAMRDAEDHGDLYAQQHGCDVTMTTIASFGGKEMSAGVLVRDAEERYVRRVVAPDRGWWLVPAGSVDLTRSYADEEVTWCYQTIRGNRGDELLYQPAPDRPAHESVPSRARLVAWGRTAREMRLAVDDAEIYADLHHSSITGAAVSFGPELPGDIPVFEAICPYARRTVTAGLRGWWLVPEDAPDLDAAFAGHVTTAPTRNPAARQGGTDD